MCTEWRSCELLKQVQHLEAHLTVTTSALGLPMMETPCPQVLKLSLASNHSMFLNSQLSWVCWRRHLQLRGKWIKSLQVWGQSGLYSKLQAILSGGDELSEWAQDREKWNVRTYSDEPRWWLCRATGFDSPKPPILWEKQVTFWEDKEMGQAQQKICDWILK